jgi:hypothetical protein
VIGFYQLGIPAPKPSKGSFDEEAAERGKAVFNGVARCSTCHVSPLFTEPGWNMHTASEIGVDDFQANRSPDKRYRTSPLKGLWNSPEGRVLPRRPFRNPEQCGRALQQLLWIGTGGTGQGGTR